MGVECKEKQIITEFPYKVRVEENVWIPLKDGTRLAARMWFPETDEPLPVILEYLPYRKRDGTRMRDDPMHGYVAGHGYIIARVDMRGSGESDGILRDEYIKQEQDDAIEVIDWLSKQSWCDGNVGMTGISWGGFNALQVAARRPTALKAIIPLGFTDDRYHDDVHYKGGCSLNENFWWGAIMMVYLTRPIDPNIVPDRWRDMWLKRLGEIDLWPGKWLEHQTRDEYWKHGSVCEDYSAIQIPVLAVDGWADSYQNSVFTLLEGLDVPRRGIIGPWAHLYPHIGVPGPAMNYLKEAVDWWDRWLKNIPNDIMDRPMIEAWIEDSMPPSSSKPVSEGRWVCLDGLPSTDIKPTEYALSRGLLKPAPDANKKDQELALLKSPLSHGIMSGEWMGRGQPGEAPPDQRIDNGAAMVFDSEVLGEPLQILGYPHFEVELMSDKPQAMLFASVCDVAPNGQSTRVSYGTMNLTHLQGHDKVVHLIPGEKVKANVKLDLRGHRFAAGHRIRLSLATSYWPIYWPMPEDATLTLDLASAKLTLPVFTGNDCEGPCMQPQIAPPTPATWLKTSGDTDRTMTYDIVNDSWTYTIGGEGKKGMVRFDEIDVTVVHNEKREMTISNTDPLSAQCTSSQQALLGREGWWASTELTLTQTSDIDNFYIKGEMKVKENEKIIFEKEWDHKVKRNGL